MNAADRKTPLQRLRKAWKKADPSERTEFLRELAESGALPAPTHIRDPEAMSISTGRYLRPSVAARIRTIMERRRMTPGNIMQELGFDPQDRSLALALARNSSLRLVVIESLEKWLAAHDEP